MEWYLYGFGIVSYRLAYTWNIFFLVPCVGELMMFLKFVCLHSAEVCPFC